MSESISLLLIEDDSEFSEILQRRFQRRGFQMVVCDTPDAALQLVAQQSFDVAIVDGTLRGHDGFGLVHELKRLSPSLKCIMLSGDSSDQAITRALDAGASDYLFKPCSLVNLEQAVNKAAELQNGEMHV